MVMSKMSAVNVVIAKALLASLAKQPFLFALRRLSVQADDWLWLAWEDRQRFTVPYAERLSKGGYAV